MKSLILALGLPCLLLATVKPSWTMDESPSSSPLHSSSGSMDVESGDDPEALLQGLELSGSPGKRTYTYVSEYKRLPLYNFGLGKRWGSGGSSNTVDEDKVRIVHRFRPSRNGASCSSSGACNPFFQRARLYSFGLGKRARPYNFGLGKRFGSPSYVVRGLGGDADYDEIARAAASSEPIEDYLEKRSRLYSIGLGKRMPGDDLGMQRFNFGLGKRPSDDFGHRYKFGLGKRRLIVDDDELQQQQQQQQQSLAS